MALMTAGATLGAAFGPLLLSGSLRAPLWVAVLELCLAVGALLIGLYVLLAAPSGWWLPGRDRQSEREANRNAVRFLRDHRKSGLDGREVHQLASAVNRVAAALEAKQADAGLPTTAAPQSPPRSKRDPSPQQPLPESGDRD